MRALDDQTMLSMWEHSASHSPVDRDVRMLAAIAGLEADAAADWPIDARDHTLIAARCRTFGSEADLYALCPACGEAHEASFDLRHLLELMPGHDDQWTWHGRTYGVKAPTSRAIAQAARGGDRRELLRLCVDGFGDGDDEPGMSEVEAAIEVRFPLVNVKMEFTCASCGHAFTSRFDAGAYLWTDIERRVEALLTDVHRLASAYGWRERDILEMSRARRAAYLARLFQ
jgi:hypothetical protein